ncbi:hypothetical protein D9615_004684 [Tricholomella constricta]|uniref:Major facilitator superfamily (MFS) profile domain-containing protein n=1 Tax=Tricholomella constricta TaxID=117010 RepID=A0A8H5HC09_9AGAR|nr:hypothetical protein D9615_004684 [Tricholomella constricta]
MLLVHINEQRVVSIIKRLPFMAAEITVKESSSSHTEVNSTDDRADRLVFASKTMRKIDLRLLPLLGILYALALIDRTNLGIARIAGMERDLELSIGSRYSIVSAIYFAPYIIFQLPSNLFLRQLGVRNWLAFCVVAWGIVQLAMGFVPNWGLLAFCRVLLGFFEAGFFPAMVFIITTWYTRHEVQKRLAAFYVVSVFIGGFSAIFAYLLSLLGGKQGIAGWAWIFIIEGAITVFFGIIAWFYIPDFPDQNTFLSEEQTAFVLDRVERDRGDSIPDELTKKKLVEHLLDWKLWAFSLLAALMYMCATMPAYAIGFFVTIILRGMGWSVTNSLLLSAPPYVFATASILFFAWISDKYRHRALFIAIQAVMTLIGLFMTGFSSSSGWRYVGIFLTNAGSGGCIPGILAYSSNNVTSHTRRAVSTAMIISFGGIGGIFATTIFRQTDFPRYLPGIYATIACQILLLFLLGITTVYFWKQNKRSRVAGAPGRDELPGFAPPAFHIMAMPQVETSSYSDSDTKAISQDFSVDSVKLEAADNSEHDAAFERKTMRYVDWRILPLLALLYSFALIDRINLGAAFTAGMGKDLELTKGSRYSIATCLYFVPYIIFQLPGNLVLRKFGVRNWLTFSVVGWGAVQLGMGFVPTWGWLTFTRILLGALEASFFPAMVYIISTWYRRHEVQKRLAIFYLLSITMGGCSPVFAWILSLLDGRRGIRGWEWIFIIEGAITLFLGILSWFYIPDFPDKNRFLTPEQTALVLKRIEEDRGDSIPDKITRKKVFKHLCDWTLWSYGTMFMCATLPAYAQAYFISIILRGLGWSKTSALLLSCPPYLPSIATTLFFSWLSDRTRHRGGFIVLQAIICIVGLVLTAFAGNGNVRYFGIFLVNAGNSGTIPGILAYAANNVVSHSKRSVQSALTVSLGGVGGIIASTVFRSQDAPRYLPGLGVSIGSQGVLIFLVLITNIHFRRLNRLSKENKLKKPLEGQPGFLYTL